MKKKTNIILFAVTIVLLSLIFGCTEHLNKPESDYDNGQYFGYVIQREKQDTSYFIWVANTDYVFKLLVDSNQYKKTYCLKYVCASPSGIYWKLRGAIGGECGDDCNSLKRKTEELTQNEIQAINLKVIIEKEYGK
jgi:hypothetical protein